MSARYQFLPWVRAGAASAYGNSDGLKPILERADTLPLTGLPVAFRVNATPVSVDLRLYGPGDVVGVDPRAIIRTEPAAGSGDFEPNHLAAIDFDAPDFPWLFTPAIAGGNGRLRPWLCLVVVRRDEAKLAIGGPLPVLDVVTSELPDLLDSYLWAHAQVVQADDTEPVAQIVASAPERTASRLICPRRLEANTAYIACLVPAFDAGRRAGLGLEVTEENHLGPAWEVTQPRAQLPVYYQWSFATGAGGDFETLADLLHGAPTSKLIGRRAVDASNQPFGLPQPGALEFQGPLTAVSPPAPPLPSATFQTALRDLLNRTDLVTPPVYANRQAAQPTVPADPAPPRWLRELNLDPVARAGAGLGAQIIQDRQEQLIASAWEQLGQADAVQRLERRLDFGIEVLGSIVRRHLEPMDAGYLLQFLGPAQSRTRTSPETITGSLAAKGVPGSFSSAAFRRVLRPAGTVGRRRSPNRPSLQALATNVRIPPMTVGPVFGMPALVSPNHVQAELEAPRPIISPGLSRFLTALTPVLQYTQRFATSEIHGPLLPFSLDATYKARLLGAVNPAQTLPKRVYARVTAAGTLVAPTAGTTVVAHPTFRAPMYAALRDRAPELLLPGVEGIEANTVTLLQSNARFIEAFMAGLNHEMSSELLWREFPGELRHTYFQTFWEGPPQIPELHQWNPAAGFGRLVHRRQPAGARDPRRTAAPLPGRADLRHAHDRRAREAADLPRVDGPGHHVPRLRADRGGRARALLRHPGAAQRAPLRARRQAHHDRGDELERPRLDRHAHAAGRTGEARRPHAARRFASDHRHVGVQCRAHGRDPAPAPGTGGLPSQQPAAAARMKTIDEIRTLAGTLPAPTTPLVLLPVQIQTRYVGSQLLVRVYPDEIHLDSHQPDLTAAEREWGRSYWELIWPAAASVPTQTRAWDALAQRFGARRAAWIARRLTPTNLAARPGTPPAFPDNGPVRAPDASTAPVARVLPDRWIVMGYNVDGARTLLEAGLPIPEALVVGPGTDEPPGPPPAAGELPLDVRMRWMVDFAEAEKVGMGIRITLPGAAPPTYATLLVFGVKTGVTPDAAATRLEALLDAHHYTRGLAFPAPGTPTNNTSEAAAGFTDLDSGGFNVEVSPPRIGTGADGLEVARLLGIRRDPLNFAAGAAQLEEFTAKRMHALLWAATGGSFLEQMITGLSTADLDAARRFFIDYVRSQGPLPTLRIGRQPYGLLPAMSLAATTADRYTRMLTILRAIWRRSLASVPHLRPGSDDELRLLEILRQQPLAAGHRVRLVFGTDTLTALSPSGLPSDLSPHRQFVTQALRDLNAQQLATATRLPDLLPADNTQPIVTALTGPTPGPALAFARTATFDDLLAETIPAGRPSTLLYALARHSVLLTQVGVAARVLIRRGLLPAGPLKEPVLVDILGNGAPEHTRTLGRLLELDPALRTSIHTRTAAQDPEAAVLDELRQALTWLETEPAANLERQLAGALDLFAWRLDPWITGLATRRLNELRRTVTRGFAIGGFGWVHDVAPEPRTPLPPGPDGLPVFAAREEGGAIHAPSMGQAAAAAILRSGYLTDNGDGSGRQPFAIDLSGSRVRVAQELLDGMREGQALGDLLGYRFERGLHDRKLDRFIVRFRREVVLHDVHDALDRIADVLTWPSGVFKIQALKAAQQALRSAKIAVRTRKRWPVTAEEAELEALAEAGVVDGLELARGLRDGRIPLDRPAAGATPVERPGLQAEARRLEEALDAVGDALTAEGVYQAVRGNLSRASASVDALAHAELQPPELEFVATPRPGAAVSHRLLVVFSNTPAPVAGASPRAAAEPALELWLRQLHGDVRLVGYRAEFLDATGKVLLRRDRQPLGTFVPCPTDALYLSAAPQPGAKSPLELLVEAAVWRGAPATIPADATLQLTLERTSDLPASWLSFSEYLELVRASREAILPARALDAADVSVDGLAADATDVVELGARADAAVVALQAARAAVVAQGADVRARLADFAFFGVVEGIPGRLVADGQLDATLAETDRRLAAATAATAPADRLHAVFGAAFRVLPRMLPANLAELNNSFRRSDELQGGDSLQALSWLQGVARVRAPASRLDALLMYAAALDRAPALELKVAQLPFVAGERWVGLSGTPARGKLSLVAHMPRPFQATAPLSGLVIDEWTESVPAAEVTTGVAFDYDAPGARPPQSVLLAVTPPGAARWEVDLIEQTLLETFELARLRAVDPQVLGGEQLFQRVLPALYVSTNLAGETISTDFARLAGI